MGATNDTADAYFARGRPRTHGTKALEQAVKVLGTRALDRRTTIGRALAAWRSELLADLGGADNVSTQELAAVRQALVSTLRGLLSDGGLKQRAGRTDAE